ncbi:Protein yellow, partial [Pseudolycoriella hygida]
IKIQQLKSATHQHCPLRKKSGNVVKFTKTVLVYQWKILDFQYPSSAHRARAIASGDFIPENNLPLGVDASAGDRLFVTMPRWKNGVPASLAWLPLPPVYRNPPLMPYPDWSFHGNPDAPDCSKLMSVYRLWIDEVLDAGIVNATIKINPVCPPKIVVFDLRTDQPLFLYELPQDQIKEDSLHSNLIVDVRNGKCDDAYAYVTDVWRFGVVVFSLAKGRSWRTTNHLYYPNPLASDFTLHGLNFQWTDGVFGMSLTPVNEYNDRLMFFHPMASTNEFMVSTSVLRNETIWLNGGLANAFIPIGDRGARGQSSTSGIDRNNVMFYNLVHQDAVGCWDTTKPYSANALDIVAKDNETLFFPNDMKLDRELNQGLWVLSNRLPVYLYSQLDYNDVNFRIQRAGVKESVD